MSFGQEGFGEAMENSTGRKLLGLWDWILNSHDKKISSSKCFGLVLERRWAGRGWNRAGG